MALDRRNFLRASAAGLLGTSALASAVPNKPAAQSGSPFQRGEDGRHQAHHRRREVQGLDEEARGGQDQDAHPPRRPRRHARVLRVLRGLPSAGGRRVLLLRPARVRLLRPAGRQEPVDGRPLPRRGRAGALGARPRELLPLRQLLGRHARDRVRAQVPEAPEGPRHLRHDGEHRLVRGRTRTSCAEQLPAETHRHARQVRGEGGVRGARVRGGDDRRRSTRSTSAGSIPWPDPVVRTFKHLAEPGLQHDAGPQRVRRQRARSRTGTAGRTCRRSRSRRSSSSAATTR